MIAPIKKTYERLRYLEVATSLSRKLRDGKLKPSEINEGLLDEWIEKKQKQFAEKNYSIEKSKEKAMKTYESWKEGFDKFKRISKSFLSRNSSKEKYGELYSFYRNLLIEEEINFLSEKYPLIYYSINNSETGLGWTLFQTAETYDIEKGSRFTTYLFWNITGSKGKERRFLMGDLKKREEQFIRRKSPKNENIEEKILKTEYLDAIEYSLGELDDIEKDILTRRYKFLEELEEIGKHHGMQKQRVHQIVYPALENLKRKLFNKINIPLHEEEDIKAEVYRLFN